LGKGEGKEKKHALVEVKGKEGIHLLSQDGEAANLVKNSMRSDLGGGGGYQKPVEDREKFKGKRRGRGVQGKVPG